jgi:hypothetical protein
MEDLVWLYVPKKKKGLSKKLIKPWIGSFKILEITSLNNAKLQRMNRKIFKQIVNITYLRLYENSERPREKLFPEDDFDIKNEENKMEIDKMENYEVDKIVNMKKEHRNDGISYNGRVIPMI